MPNSKYWLELAERGRQRFGDRFAEVKTNTKHPTKLGVWLTDVWKPQPLRIDFVKNESSDRPSVKLLESHNVDRKFTRPLIEYAMDNCISLMGPAAQKIKGSFIPSRNAGEKMNALYLKGPIFRGFEHKRKNESMDWFLDGFEIYESLLLPKLLEKYRNLTAE